MATPPDEARLNNDAFYSDYFERLIARATGNRADAQAQEPGSKPPIKDREAALQLIGEYVCAVDERRPPHPILLDYILEALSAIRGGEDANDALNVKRPAHRPSGNRRERSIQVAAALQLRLNQKIPVSRARDEVAEEYSVDPKTVERALADNPEIELLTPDELRALAAKTDDVDKK